MSRSPRHPVNSALALLAPSRLEKTLPFIKHLLHMPGASSQSFDSPQKTLCKDPNFHFAGEETGISTEVKKFAPGHIPSG